MIEDDGLTTGATDLPVSLLVVGTVAFTVILGILFSLADNMQVGLPRQIRPPLIAFLNTRTSVPPTVVLPSSTPTPTATLLPSATSTRSIDQKETATPTAIAVPVLAEESCGNIPAGWNAYHVRPGDTLFKLSLNSGATVSEIARANCLDLNILYSGTQIYLPQTPPARPPCGPPLWWTRYIVQPGDTLFSLARTRGTTVFAIMQANCLVSSKIFYGRSILLPPLSETATPVPTYTPLPTATSVPSPEPTKVPKPTKTSKPTDTPIPSATSTNTKVPTPTPSNTPKPHITETPSNTPVPTDTSEPTMTHTPTNTPVSTATPTPAPTDTPLPTNTPTSTYTPTPTPTFTHTPTFTPTSSPTPTETPIPGNAPGPIATETRESES